MHNPLKFESIGTRAKPTYRQLLGAGEPFRLLFPLGTIIGVIGVLMWPLYIWGGSEFYPGQHHARIMIQAFLGCFVFGFLGTALPRLLEVPKFSLLEPVVFAVGFSALTLLHYHEYQLYGDLLFLALISLLLLAFAIRLPHRKDTPPPAFILVAMGLLSALLGTGLLVAVSLAPAQNWGSLFPLGKLLLYQAFLLLPIMGIGAFLLPRFFGEPTQQHFPESLKPTPAWLRKAAFAFTCGSAVLLSFVLESNGLFRTAYLLRTAALLIYLLREIPVFKTGYSGGAMAFFLRIALLSFPVGYALMAIWPNYAYYFIHVIMITGFSLITFVVATRVVLGHGGQSHLFKRWGWPVTAMGSLLIIAMLTRVTADFMPSVKMSHYGYAAIVWIAAVLIWSLPILRHVKNEDS